MSLSESFKKLVAAEDFNEDFGRCGTMVAAAEHFAQDKQGCIVETGCCRMEPIGDGHSTYVLGTLAKELGVEFYSVDISQTSCDFARLFCQKRGVEVTVSCADSVAFLSKFNKPIGFLYLDSYDYDSGNEENIKKCQRHQLAEVGAAYGKLTENACILMDDCKLPLGGKSAMCAAFLEQCGWKRVKSNYQWLYTR